MENSAYKLHAILNQVYEKSNVTLSRSPSYRKTWAEIFGINEEDTSALLTSLTSMIGLWTSTKEYLLSNELLDDESDLVFINRIDRTVGHMNFEGDMSYFTQYMDKETLTALRFMGKNMKLVYKFKEQTIKEEEINELIFEIESLIESITESKLQDEVKLLLFKNLNLIKESLFTFKITGSDGMKLALEQTIGSLFINNEIIAPVVQDVEVSRTFGIIDKLNILLATGVSAKDLIAPITNLLLK